MGRFERYLTLWVALAIAGGLVLLAIVMLTCVSIIGRALKAFTDEMSISMEKTTRSPILCEARDFVTGLYDAKGRMLEQTENLPILSFSLAPVCKYIREYYGDDLHEGDVIFHNDVFSLGNQLNDVAVYKPIFHRGVLVGWSAAKGHQADIGGAVRGGYNPNATEVWQEALRIPPVKVYEKGRLRRDVWNLIFANIRLPIVQEDMRAEIGSCTVGERRLLALRLRRLEPDRELARLLRLLAQPRGLVAEPRRLPLRGRRAGEGLLPLLLRPGDLLAELQPLLLDGEGSKDLSALSFCFQPIDAQLVVGQPRFQH